MTLRVPAELETYRDLDTRIDDIELTGVTKDANGAVVIDTADGTGTTLKLSRGSGSGTNTNMIQMQNFVTGGRSTINYRDENGDDLVRLVAHNELDTGLPEAQFVMYTRRATPRPDGNMMAARFDVDAKADIVRASFERTYLVVGMGDTDDTDAPTTTLLQAERHDASNVTLESASFVQSRTSGEGSNYIYRNLAATDTAGPLLRIANLNSGDDQLAVRIIQTAPMTGVQIEQNTAPTGSSGAALRVFGATARTSSGARVAKFEDQDAGTTQSSVEITNVGSGSGLVLTQTGTGRALNIAHTDTGSLPTVDLNRTGNSASKIGGIRINAVTNAGAGGVYGLRLATDLPLEMGTATGTGKSYIEVWEQSADPAAPAANSARWFCRDNGSGKTQLCVRFPTGATQVISTEP